MQEAAQPQQKIQIESRLDFDFVKGVVSQAARDEVAREHQAIQQLSVKTGQPVEALQREAVRKIDKVPSLFVPVCTLRVVYLVST